MTEFLFSAIIVLLAFGGLALGILLGRGPISGGCSGNGSCDGACSRRCERQESSEQEGTL